MNATHSSSTFPRSESILSPIISDALGIIPLPDQDYFLPVRIITLPIRIISADQVYCPPITFQLASIFFRSESSFCGSEPLSIVKNHHPNRIIPPITFHSTDYPLPTSVVSGRSEPFRRLPFRSAYHVHVSPIIPDSPITCSIWQLLFRSIDHSSEPPIIIRP